MTTKDLLFEIGYDLLPPTAQESLAEQLDHHVQTQLRQHAISFGQCQLFSTYRRIAVLICDVSQTQSPQQLQKIGPREDRAYDKDGTPTIACMGFARSAGVSIDQLNIIQHENENRVSAITAVPGKSTESLLPDILNQAIRRIGEETTTPEGSPLPSQPALWITAVYGNQIIPIQVRETASTNKTHGHQFHHRKPLTLLAAREYPHLLHMQGNVIASRTKRKQRISKEAHRLAGNDEALLTEASLDFITSVVEWPIIHRITFPEHFLTLPASHIISALQTFPTTIPIIDRVTREPKSTCLIVCNTESPNPSIIIEGHQRAITARLHDAQYSAANNVACPQDALST